MDDDLGVAARAEHVPERRQLGHQLPVVVDLAVEDDDDGAVLVEHRLLAGRQVDDRQALVAQRDAGRAVHAGLVGPAVMLRLVHAQQRGRVEVRVPRESQIPTIPHMAEVLAAECGNRRRGRRPRQRL